MHRFFTLKAFLIGISGIVAATGLFIYNQSSHASLMAGGGASGTVFRDYNGDGIKQASEPLVAGVTVTAYTASGSVCASTVTGSTTAPNYTLMNASCSGPIRIEFSIESTTDCIDSLLDFTSTNGGVYGSSVQFVDGSVMPANVNFALNNPADYNKGSANTSVYVPCYTNGNPLGGGTSGLGSWFVGFPYNNSGNVTPPPQILNGVNIGATWGVAYSKQAKKVFTSAFIKRHVGLGTLGSGGIYTLTPTATSFTASTLYDMDAAGHRTRAAAGAPAYGVNSSFDYIGTPATKLTYMGAPDPLTGKPSGFGVVGTNAQRGLPAAANLQNFDPAAMAQVGKVGLGDLEISDDGEFLYVMNLYSRHLFRLQLNDPYNPTSVIAVDSFAMPAAPCTNGVLRPFATKFYRNKLYIGAVCSGENGGTTTVENNMGPAEPTNLSAQVYELIDPTGGSPSFNVTPVFSKDLNYTKGPSVSWTGPLGKQWYPWTDSTQTLGTNATIQDRTYPTPQLSDIEFSDRGDMVLSFTDRTGNQYGWYNYRYLSPVLSGTNALILPVSGGDILMAGLNCGTGVYTLENLGSYNSDGIIKTSTGAAVGEGPGGDEFFDQDNIPCCHNETHGGSVAVLRGDDKVITTVMDPTTIREGGSVKYSFSNGVKSSAYRLFYSVDNSLTTGTFGKSNGLGDIELSGVEPPLELGNRVWADTDGDGIQDPGEPALPNITVQIYDGVTLIGTDVTDGNGNYYFDTTNIADGNQSVGGAQKGIQPNRTYTIIIGSADWSGNAGVNDLAGYVLTNTNTGGGSNPDLNDNDASILSMVPTITYTTGNWGENNHTLDFGFTFAPAPLPVDLALRKTIADTLHNSANLNLNNGDTIKFKIKLFNQGQVSMDSLNITDYLPAGFKFINATGTGQLNEGWDGTDPSNPIYKWRSNTDMAGAFETITAKTPLDAAFTGDNETETGASFSHDPGTGSNRLLLVGIAAGASGGIGEPVLVDSVYFKGEKMNFVGFTQSPGAGGSNDNDAAVYIFSLTNPSSGSGTVQLYLNGTGDIVAQAVTFNGVNQDNPLGAYQSTNGINGSPISENFTSQTNELLYTLFGLDQGGSITPNPASSNQSVIFDASVDVISGAAVTEPGAAVVTSNFTFADNDWAMGAVSIKPAPLVGPFNPGDSIEVCIYTTLAHVPGSPTAADFTNYSEISYARDTNGVDQSANDIDSPLNNNPNDNAGGQPKSAADDYLNGNGTGTIGDGIAATDQDNHDPAMLDVFDLALKKTIDTSSIASGTYGVGDTIQFNITVTNQGTITAQNIQITDTIPCGLTFSANQSVSWSVPSPMTTYTIPGPLLPGQSVSVPINLIINNSCSYFVNYAQISQAQDLAAVNQNGDIDGPYDQNFADDGGGKVNSNSDDVITGDGTGVPLDEIADTDADDQDPAELQVFDLALKKIISPLTLGYPGAYAVNNLIRFDITIYNQGNISADTINIVDYLPAGLSFSAGDNGGLWLTGPGANQVQRTIILDGGNTLDAGEDTTVSIFLQVVHTTGGIPAYTNISEITSATAIIGGNNVRLYIDADSPYDTNSTNDAGGLVSSAADNEIFGSGTGTAGDGVAATDEDAHDPALVPIVDLALKKLISSSSPGPFEYGDTVTFDITVTNQGTVHTDSVEVTDYIPVGFSFFPQPDWALTGSNATRVIKSRLDPAEDTVITIELILNSVTDLTRVDSAWTNFAEVSQAYDTLGNDISLQDIDSPLNDIDSDNKGGQPQSLADNYILGDGTGAIGDGVDTTDQDNHDPTLVEVVDLALKKVVKDTLGDAMLNFGDTIRFDIHLFNQGNVPMDSLEITDYIPFGFEFIAGLNPGWTGSAPTSTYAWGTADVLMPGESDTVTIYLRLIEVGEPNIDKYTNYAEISFASDTNNIEQSDNDADSPLNNIDNDNPGGQPLTAADDAVDGDGSGMVGDGIAGTD